VDLPCLRRDVVVAAVIAGQANAAGRTVRVGVYQNKPKIFMDETVMPQVSSLTFGRNRRRDGWTLRMCHANGPSVLPP